MEPYRNYGRGGYGRNGGMNRCGVNTNYNRNMGANSCQGARPNPHQRMGTSPNMPVAMAYVPMQQWSSLCSPEAALCQGTAFPELNLVFCGSRGKM